MHCRPLAPLQLSLRDMFIPIQVGGGGDGPHGEPSGALWVLWTCLLGAITDHWGAAERLSPEMTGVCSVKLVPVPEAPALRAILRSLRPFCCPVPPGAAKRAGLGLPAEAVGDGEGGPETVVRALAFLPPSWHLLLQFEVRAAETLVKIGTDFPPVLSHIDDALEDIFSPAAAS